MHENDLFIVIVIGCPLLLFLLVWATKLWRGRWLRSIAGNQLVSDEEYGSPYQKALGKRTAIVLFAGAFMLAALLIRSCFLTDSNSTVSTAGAALVNASLALFLIAIVWHLMKTVIENRRRMRAMTEDEYPTEDRRIDRKAGIILVLIVIVVTTISLVGPFLNS